MTLQEFFEKNPSAAIAFSGGVDSAYLLYAGLQYGRDITAYYVKSAFQPQFELEDALRLAKELGAKLRVLELTVLDDPDVKENGPRRCYYCKRRIFSAITAAARGDGYTLLLDGTNASDAEDDRPGMQALRELSVRSPLRECGLTKPTIRELSREAGLFTWNKPAYACLATRIPTGTSLTLEDLAVTEKGEQLLAAMGFSDFRIRKLGGIARLQLPEAQLDLLLANRTEVLQALKELYSGVVLDLEVRA